MTWMDDARRYREGAERMRATRPEVAAQLEAHADAVEEAGRHADHSFRVEFGATVCSCGTVVGLSTWAPG
jgi:hypothetical protein